MGKKKKKELEEATVYNCCPQINPLFHIILTNFRLNQSIYKLLVPIVIYKLASWEKLNLVKFLDQNYSRLIECIRHLCEV